MAESLRLLKISSHCYENGLQTLLNMVPKRVIASPRKGRGNVQAQTVDSGRNRRASLATLVMKYS